MFTIALTAVQEWTVIQMAKWIYDGDCLITSCCNTAYDIGKFERNGELIYVPCECPNCGAELEPLKDGDAE